MEIHLNDTSFLWCLRCSLFFPPFLSICSCCKCRYKSPNGEWVVAAQKMLRLFSMSAFVLRGSFVSPCITNRNGEFISEKPSSMLTNHNSEYLPGSASLPTSPVAPIAPSSAVASRLARSSSDSQAEKGTSNEYESDHTWSPPPHAPN